MNDRIENVQKNFEENYKIHKKRVKSRLYTTKKNKNLKQKDTAPLLYCLCLLYSKRGYIIHIKDLIVWTGKFHRPKGS